MLMKDLQAKTTNELKDLIVDLKAQLFMLHFKNSTGQHDQTHKIKLIKKDIARVLMTISQKEKAEPKTIKVKATAKPKKAAIAKYDKKKDIKQKPEQQVENHVEHDSSGAKQEEHKQNKVAKIKIEAENINSKSTQTTVLEAKNVHVKSSKNTQKKPATKKGAK